MTQVRNLVGGTGIGLGIVALVTMVVLAACAPQAADQSAELAPVTERWIEALNVGDEDGLAALYAEDCLIMPPNTALGTGQAFAREMFGSLIDAGLTGGLETISVAATGNIGFHTGTYWLQTADGTSVDQGKFTETWQKVDGEWKIASDIWNSDLAPFAGTTTIAITHDVKNGDHWLAAWQGENSRRQLFAQHGVENVRVFQNPENPNQTGLLVDVSDMAAFEAMLNSDEGAAAKAEDGVIDKSMRVYAEVK